MSCSDSAQAEIVVHHPHGLHARPAAAVVRQAAGFEAEVRIRNLSRDGSTSRNAKSLTDLLLAAIECEHRIRISAEGVEAQEAVNALVVLIERL
jgi:phosphotransferase system HPr (HPr) family protein